MSSLTIGSVKTHEIYKQVDALMSTIPLHKRILPLLKTICIIKKVPMQTKLDLWNATGVFERDCDRFYIKFSYSEKVHKEECDFLKCMVDIIREYEKEPFTISSLKDVILSFTKTNHNY